MSILKSTSLVRLIFGRWISESLREQIEFWNDIAISGMRMDGHGAEVTNFSSLEFFYLPPLNK